MDTLKHRLRPGWWGHRGLLQAAIAAFVVVSLCGTWLAYRRSISALRRRAIAIVRDQGMYAPTGDMRQHALRLMGQSRTAELLPFAIPLLNDPDPRIREAAIRALEPLASANELDTLQALARQRPVTAVQLFAARATERIRPGAADDLIGDALTQSPASLRVQGDLILFRPDDRTRTARLKAWFTQYASGASIPLLTDVLSRLVAARDLDALRKLNELLATLPESPDRIRLASLAVEYSTGSEQRAYEILTELAGRNGDLQVQAARALVELGRTSVCPQLSEVARSSAHSINRRLVAVGGLAICARDEDVRVLRDLMDDAQPIAALRLEAAGAFLSLLANQPMREGLAVNRWLLQAQQSASEQQRELAMLALGLSEDSDAVEGLLAGLSDRSTRVRLQAIRALARKPTRSAALALQQALQDGDKTVQEASIAALRDVLTGLSSSGDRGVRSLLMPTVERLAQDTGNSLQIPAQGLLLRLGNTKPRGELAAVAVGSESRLRLRAIPWIDDTSVLRSGLVNQDVEVRIASALRLSELGSQEGIPVLREASRTGELLGLRSYVALLRMAVPTPPPPDIDSLLTTAAPDIRSQAIELLANLSPGAAAAKLRLVLHDHSPSLRYQAVDVALRLLRKRPEQPLIEALQASLQQETESVIRVQVQEALQQALARRDLRLQPQERPDAPASKALVAPIRASTSPALTTAPQVSATAPSSSGHTGPEPGTPVELARGTLVLSGPRSLRIRINDGVPLTLPVAPQVVGPGIYRISYIGGSKIVTVSPGQRVAIELPANAVLNQLYEELPTTSRLQVVDEASFNADRLAMFERRVEQAPGDPELKHNLLMQVAMQYDMYGYAKRACAIYAKLANTEVAASIDQDGRLTRARKKCTAQK